MSNLKTLKILSCITIVCCVFAISEMFYHKNAESHESMRILILEILRLYGM